MKFRALVHVEYTFEADSVDEAKAEARIAAHNYMEVKFYGPTWFTPQDIEITEDGVDQIGGAS